VTSTVTDTPQTEYKQCSTCGFATPATRTRCHNCWNRLEPDAPLLEAGHAADLVERQEIYLAERSEADRARKRRRRLIFGGIGLALLAWIGWWIYGTFIYSPPAVPEASNPALAVLTGDEVWATSGGDLLASRQTGASVPLDGAEVWSASLGGAPVTPLVADSERVYGVTEDRLLAVSTEDGAVAWEFNLQGAPFSAPTLAGDRLYVALRAGQLLALEAATGEVVFQSLNTGVRFGTSPIVADGYAYVFGIGDLVAFDADTGEVLWSTPNRAGGLAFTNPVVTDRYIAGLTGDEVLVFDRRNGAQTYFYEFLRAFPYSSVGHDGVIYASSRQYTVAFEETSGRPWWEEWRAVWNQFWIWGMAPDIPVPEQIWQNNSPLPDDGFPGAIAGDSLVMVSQEGEVLALRLDDGSEVWRVDGAETDIAVRGPVSTADGVLVPFANRLALYDQATGDLLGERPVEGAELSDVVVTSTGMYVLAEDGTLTAIR